MKTKIIQTYKTIDYMNQFMINHFEKNRHEMLSLAIFQNDCNKLFYFISLNLVIMNFINILFFFIT